MDRKRKVKTEGMEHSKSPRTEANDVWRQDQRQQPHPVRQAVHSGFPVSAAMNPTMMTMPSFYGHSSGMGAAPPSMTPRFLGNPYACAPPFASGHGSGMPPTAPPAAFSQLAGPSMFQPHGAPFSHPLHGAHFQSSMGPFSRQHEQLRNPQQHASSREQRAASVTGQHSAATSGYTGNQAHTKAPSQANSRPAASSTKQSDSTRRRARRKHNADFALPRATLDLKAYPLAIPASWSLPEQCLQGRQGSGPNAQEESSTRTQQAAQDGEHAEPGKAAGTGERSSKGEAHAEAQHNETDAAGEARLAEEQKAETSTEAYVGELQDVDSGQHAPGTAAASMASARGGNDSHSGGNTDKAREPEGTATSKLEQPAKRSKEELGSPEQETSAVSGGGNHTAKQEVLGHAGKGMRMLDRRLHTACRLNSIQLALRCLQKGADPHARDDKGVSSLALAASCGHEVLLELLLNAVEDVNVETPRIRTALHHAMQRGHQSIVNQLVHHGADVEASDARGVTPRMLAERHELEIPDSSEGRSSSRFFVNQHVAVLLGDTWTHAQITEIDDDQEGGVNYHVALARGDEERVMHEQHLRRLTLEMASQTRALEAVSLGGSGLRHVSTLPDNLPNRPFVFVVNDTPTVCFGTAHLDLTWALITVVTQDHEDIRAGNIPQLPASSTVKTLLSDWAKKHAPLSPTLDMQAAAMQELFRTLLPVRLLYEQEQQQYKELTQANPRGFDVCDAYGARHFLRLFLLLPELMYTTSARMEQIQDLLKCVQSLLRFLDARVMSFLET